MRSIPTTTPSMLSSCACLDSTMHWSSTANSVLRQYRFLECGHHLQRLLVVVAQPAIASFRPLEVAVQSGNRYVAPNPLLESVFQDLDIDHRTLSWLSGLAMMAAMSPRVMKT